MLLKYTSNRNLLSGITLTSGQEPCGLTGTYWCFRPRCLRFKFPLPRYCNYVEVKTATTPHPGPAVCMIGCLLSVVTRFPDWMNLWIPLDDVWSFPKETSCVHGDHFFLFSINFFLSVT